MSVRTVVLRVVALALLLLLALVASIGIRTMQRLPDSVIYLVASTPTHFRLEPVHRRVGGADLEERLRNAVYALAAGPTAAERDAGLHSSVPADVRILGLRVEDGIVRIDLTAEFERGGGSAEMTGRIQQLLYTLTHPTGLDGVALSIEGRGIHVFGGEGLIIGHPWRRPEETLLPSW